MDTSAGKEWVAVSFNGIQVYRYFFIIEKLAFNYLSMLIKNQFFFLLRYWYDFALEMGGDQFIGYCSFLFFLLYLCDFKR